MPSDNIRRGQYLIFETRRDLQGQIEIEVGAYDKSLSDRLAELFASSKKVDALLRDRENIETGESIDMYTTLTIKPIRIKITRKGTESGSYAPMGDTLAGATDDKVIYEEEFIWLLIMQKRR